ncbi:MAG: DegT/DnrJ/EryC1/StrS family aminotransferase [Nitrospiraceae bacterium]|nr:DegT/DnrJ/EryC1/StrS family aminotransferase [Nitrospiraceae bacterium]
MTLKVQAAPVLFGETWSSVAMGMPPVLLDRAISLQFSASNALWQGLRQLGLKPGDRVLFPAYHCGAELDVCVKAELNIAFYDVDPSLSIDWTALHRLVDARTRALFVIHYFGFPVELEPAHALCREHGLALIEDCAHALYSRDLRNQACGQSGAMAVYSLRKFLPVPEGGALRSASVSDSAVPPPAEETFSMLRFEAQRSAHRVGIPMRRRVMARAAGTAGIPFAFWNRLTGRRRHPRANDPSLDFGVAGADWGMSTLSRWIVERTDHAAVVRRRRANFAELIGRIGSTGLVRPLFTALPDGACPWLCPVVVDDADGLIDYLRRRGIEAAPLWRETHAQWPAERFPSAGWLKQRAVALPIHQDLTVEHMQWMAKEIEQWQPSA